MQFVGTFPSSSSTGSKAKEKLGKAEPTVCFPRICVIAILFFFFIRKNRPASDYPKNLVTWSFRGILHLPSEEFGAFYMEKRCHRMSESCFMGKRRGGFSVLVEWWRLLWMLREEWLIVVFHFDG